MRLTDKVATKRRYIHIHIHVHRGNGKKPYERKEQKTEVDRQKKSILIHFILVQRTMNDGSVMSLRLFNTQPTSSSLNKKKNHQHYQHSDEFS